MSDDKEKPREKDPKPETRPSPTCCACGEPLVGYDRSGYGGACGNPDCSINRGESGTW